MSLLKKMKGEKDKYGALVMKAINYILDDEEAFKKFLHDGRIEMHNNANPFSATLLWVGVIG